MTISELIKVLKDIKKEHGDMKVYIADYNDGYIDDLYDLFASDIEDSVFEKGKYYKWLGREVEEKMLLL